MPKVLLLYPGPVSFRQAQVAAHRGALEAHGIELVLADDYIVDSDRDFFAETLALPAPEQVGEALRIVEAWLARNTIDAVLAQSEAGLLLGALVAQKLGLPCVAPDAALLTVNKFLSRERLASARLAQPRYVLASTSAEVRAFARDAGYPVVLKGVASALGRLVTLVNDDAAVDDAVAHVRARLPESTDIRRLVDFCATARLDMGCDPARQFLVEAFAHGVAIETDGVIAGSGIHTFGATEQVLSKPPLFFMKGYLLPADRTDAELAAIERTSDAALRALGLTNTGFSIEMRLARGVASIIEVNGRLGWDEGFGEMFATITGMQPAFRALQIALGIDVPFVRRRDLRCALASSSCYEDAIVKRLPDAAAIARVEKQFDVRADHATYEGARMFAPPHPDVTPHVMWALATHPLSSHDAYETARSAVDSFEVEFEAVPPATF
jgi:biotin carboxylase